MEPRWQNPSFQNEVALPKTNITDMAKEYKLEQEIQARQKREQEEADSRRKLESNDQVLKFIGSGFPPRIWAKVLFEAGERVGPVGGFLMNM